MTPSDKFQDKEMNEMMDAYEKWKEEFIAWWGKRYPQEDFKWLHDHDGVFMMAFQTGYFHKEKIK